MRKQLTGAERRQWIDPLLERYASTVWSSLIDFYEFVADAEDAFVQVFVVAILRLTTFETSQLSESFIEACLEQVKRSVVPHVIVEEIPVEAQTESVDVDLTADNPEASQNASETPSTGLVPTSLVVRTSQMMQANIARQEALRHHKGPFWARVGASITVIVGVIGITYGVSDGVLGHFAPNQPVAAKSSKPNLPRDVGDLPVTTVATYTISTHTFIDLRHIAVASNALFVGDLVETTDNWPRITAFQETFQQNKALVPSTGRPYSIELVPPVQSPEKTGVASSPWQISAWTIQTMGHWLVAVVTWSNGEKNATEKEQIYAMNIDTGKYSLLQTLSPQAGVSNRFTVAVGANRIVTQSALQDRTGSTPLGLPILVNTLTGDDPLRALTQTSQIPASFGLMDKPIATADGLVFQGIVGQSETTSANSSTWYSLSWTGALTRLDGPPIDGQAHWAVRGIAGSLWWVETTPDSQSDKEFQVSMAPLTSTKSAVAARNLNNPVEQLGVSGPYMVWTEPMDSTHRRLVVAQVQ